MTSEINHQRIESFQKRFGEAHLYLAYHAAFPLSLTPDLVYRIWMNFQRDNKGNILKNETGFPLHIPWIAVSDLLLSEFCNEVAHELYEMNQELRNELLKRMREDERFGRTRIKQLSEFLLKYIEDKLQNADPFVRNFANAQKWITMAYTEPNKIARDLAKALSSRVKENDKAGIIRVASLVETIAEPLIDEGLEHLLSYSRGMEKFVRGDIDNAKIQIDKIIRAKRRIKVEGLNLYVISDDDNAITYNIPFLKQPEIPKKVDYDRLPIPSSELIGRSKELELLNQAFNDPKKYVISIIAGGGVGKSALIYAWLDRIKPDYGGAKLIFGWSFYSQGAHEKQISCDLFFHEAFRFFGYDRELPKDEVEKGKELAKCLRNKPSVLILDGMEPLQYPVKILNGEIRDTALKELLRCVRLYGLSDKSLVVISSRQPIVEYEQWKQGYEKIDLNVLNDMQSADLLRTLGIRGSREDLEKAGSTMGGNALGLVLLGRLLIEGFNGDIRQHNELLPQILRQINNKYPELDEYLRLQIAKNEEAKKDKDTLQFDLLVVDDDPKWRDVILESLGDMFSFDISNSYQEATRKIINNRYKIICMDLKITSYDSSSIANGRKLLRFLGKNYPHLPVVLISGYLIGDPTKYREEYPNIVKLLIKGDSDDFVVHLYDSIREIYHSNTHDKNDVEMDQRIKTIMIIELLTKETVNVGIKFLFARLGKIVDRLNDEQLAIIKKAESAKNDQELETIKESMRELRKFVPQIDSVDSFVLWVEEQVGANHDDLLQVSSLMLTVLTEKRKFEEDRIKKEKLLRMEAALANEINEFKNILGIGDMNPRIRRSLYERMKKIIDFIR